METKSRAELVVVGTGYRAIGDLTLQAREYLEKADKVLFLIGDPLVAEYIARLNPTAESLHVFYAKGKRRDVSYREMVERILEEVHKGQLVCAAFYGHPGVFADPPHAAVRRARAENIPARMFPAVSAEDWLFADLGIDPGRSGCQSFEASDFLIRHRVFDPTSVLVLWQVGVVGMLDRDDAYDNRTGIEVVVEALLRAYDGDHEVIVYEASPYVVCEPRVTRVPLAKLADAELSAVSTLVVPPLPERPVDTDVLSRITGGS